MINIQVEKNGGETSASLLRRFQKKVQSSRIVAKAKSKRYSARALSDLKKKEATLNTINKKEKIKKLIKLGKISPRYHV